MRDITRQMLAYRECARSVWNTYFRELDDGWHEFIPVERALFGSLVLAQVFETHYVRKPEMDVWVAPQFGPNGVDALWAIERDNRSDWEEFRLLDTSIRLKFCEFFDWSNEGYQDMAQVRCEVIESADDRLKGAQLRRNDCGSCMAIIQRSF